MIKRLLSWDAKGVFTAGILFALLVVCGACSTLSVTTDYNPNYNFSTLRTYAWLVSKEAPSNDARINNALMVDRVRAAVERTLTAKGYVLTDADSADFMVSWLGAIDKKIQVETMDNFYSPYGYGPLGMDPFWGDRIQTVVREYEEGTLIVDILDPKQHKLIWRGVGKERLDTKSSPEAVTKGINKAVTAILKDFPAVVK